MGFKFKGSPWVFLKYSTAPEDLPSIWLTELPQDLRKGPSWRAQQIGPAWLWCLAGWICPMMMDPQAKPTCPRLTWRICLRKPSSLRGKSMVTCSLKYTSNLQVEHRRSVGRLRSKNAWKSGHPTSAPKRGNQWKSSRTRTFYGPKHTQTHSLDARKYPSLGHSQSDQGPPSTILRTRRFYAPRSKTSKTAMFGKSSSQPPITPMSFPYFSGDRWLGTASSRLASSDT